jgi:RND superfamily putative drug exporter
MVFAGATLLSAVSGLALTGISFLAWLGYSAAVVVALALGAALTLVPALLHLLGPRVLPRAEARAFLAGEYSGLMHDPGDDSHLDRGGWARIANTVTSRPWPFAIGATAALLVLAAPMLTMKFHQVDATALPDTTTAHVAEDLMVEAFGPGATGPLAIVAQMYRIAAPPEDLQSRSGDPRTQDERLTAITSALRDVPGVDTVGKPVVSTDGGVALWRMVPDTGASDPTTEALVQHLRRDVLPQMTQGQGMVAYVGGITAARADLTERVAERLRPFILGVASLSFLLLLLAYRSLVIPAKAAAMNLLSICAAYGVVVAVFQWGWGAPAIGLDGPVPIESYVPMMMFAILFGLSMDYEVFLLTAFTEHFQRSGDVVTAIRRGLADTGQVITSAAAIMVLVFASFVILDNSVIKMFGVGLATAVLVDASLVRCVLVPALMVLAASVTWWLPRWLDRILPHLHVEGDPTALDGVSQPRQTTPSDSRPGAGWLAVTVGVLFGWWQGSSIGSEASATPLVGLPVAIGAAGGALLVWLPRATARGGALPATRFASLLAGAAMAVLAYTLVGAVTPATERNPALQAGACVLLPLMAIAATALRRVAIPMALGVVGMASALVVCAPTPATLGVPVLVACVPAAMAMAATLVAAAIGRFRARIISPWLAPEEHGAEPEPRLALVPARPLGARTSTDPAPTGAGPAASAEPASVPARPAPAPAPAHPTPPVPVTDPQWSTPVGSWGVAAPAASTPVPVVARRRAAQEPVADVGEVTATEPPTEPPTEPRLGRHARVTP